MGDINNKEEFLIIEQLQPCQKSSLSTHSSYRTHKYADLQSPLPPPQLVTEPVPGLIFLSVDLFIAKFLKKKKKCTFQTWFMKCL